MMTTMADPQSVNELIARFNAAVVNTRLYSEAHPQVGRQLSALHGHLRQVLEHRQELTMLCIGDELVANQTALASRSPHISQFLKILKDKGVERISFSQGLSADHLQTLVRDLASENAPLRSSTFINLGKVKVSDSEAVGGVLTHEEISDEMAEELQQLVSVRDLRLDELKLLYQQMRGYRKVDVRGVDDMIMGFIRGFSKGLSPMRLLANIKTADEYTFTHVVNVCLLTMALAESVGFQGRQLYDIGIASVLHDVGKQFIPDEIINKPGKLTPQERAVIETHSIKGARYIMTLEGMPKLAVLGALEHHIRYDGTGYPALGNSWKPNIVSQIIAIADVFDAMRSRRPYQGPKPQELILKILGEEKGTTFNPLLVDNFIKLIHA